MSGKYPSKRQLIMAAGITRRTMDRVLAGYPWTSATLDALANALDVSSASLLTEVDAAEVPPPEPRRHAAVVATV